MGLYMCLYEVGVGLCHSYCDATGWIMTWMWGEYSDLASLCVRKLSIEYPGAGRDP
jgi:hypothetical protein